MSRVASLRNGNATERDNPGEEVRRLNYEGEYHRPGASGRTQFDYLQYSLHYPSRSLGRPGRYVHRSVQVCAAAVWDDHG